MGAGGPAQGGPGLRDGTDHCREPFPYTPRPHATNARSRQPPRYGFTGAVFCATAVMSILYAIAGIAGNPYRRAAGLSHLRPAGRFVASGTTGTRRRLSEKLLAGHRLIADSGRCRHAAPTCASESKVKSPRCGDVTLEADLAQAIGARWHLSNFVQVWRYHRAVADSIGAGMNHPGSVGAGGRFYHP